MFPTDNSTLPPLPPTAFPDSIPIDPDAPLLVVPLVKDNLPLTPSVPAN